MPRTPSRATKLALVAKIYARDGALCKYCGMELLAFSVVKEMMPQAADLPVNYPTLDHVRPRCRGGRWTMENLVVACPRCNGEKGSTAITDEGIINPNTTGGLVRKKT